MSGIFSHCIPKHAALALVVGVLAAVSGRVQAQPFRAPSSQTQPEGANAADAKDATAENERLVTDESASAEAQLPVNGDGEAGGRSRRGYVTGEIITLRAGVGSYAAIGSIHLPTLQIGKFYLNTGRASIGVVMLCAAATLGVRLPLGPTGRHEFAVGVGGGVSVSLSGLAEKISEPFGYKRKPYPYELDPDYESPWVDSMYGGPIVLFEAYYHFKPFRFFSFQTGVELAFPQDKLLGFVVPLSLFLGVAV